MFGEGNHHCQNIIKILKNKKGLVADRKKSVTLYGFLDGNLANR